MRLEIRGEYPPDWDAIGDAVRAEAGNRCIRCGHPQGDRPGAFVPCDDRCSHPRDGKMRILTVHHLNGDKSASDSPYRWSRRRSTDLRQDG